MLIGIQAGIVFPYIGVRIVYGYKMFKFVKERMLNKYRYKNKGTYQTLILESDDETDILNHSRRRSMV